VKEKIMTEIITMPIAEMTSRMDFENFFCRR